MTNRTATTLAVAAGAVGVAVLALPRRGRDVTDDRARASRTVTIRRDAAALYALWRDAQQFPQFFRGVRGIETSGAGRERWTVDAAGRSALLDVEIVDDRPPTRFEWRVLGKAGLHAQGSLTLLPAPGDRGTQARLVVSLSGATAKATAAFARLFGASPPQIAHETLRAFKALAEAGEVPKAVRN